MFRRFSNGWSLLKASWAVLIADKELVVFPIVSMIGVIIVCITFAVPIFASGVLDKATTSGNSDSLGIFGVVVTFLFYAVMYTVIIFCNSALVGAAIIRLRGGDPTLGDGIRMAMQNIGGIVGYALISATVGMILRSIQSGARNKGIAGIVISLVAAGIGFTWTIATFLVVPVLVIEKLGPIEAIKRSSSLLKQTWGEQLTGNFALGGIMGLISLAVIIAVGGLFGMLTVATNSTAIMVVGIALVVFILVALSLLGSTLQGIYVAAVYCYATEGVEAAKNSFFDADLVQNAFQPKGVKA